MAKEKVFHLGLQEFLCIIIGFYYRKQLNLGLGYYQVAEVKLMKHQAKLINDTFKGKGYGTEAQQLLIGYAINTLGLKVAYADVVHRNYRSKHILEKLGFKHLYNDVALSYYKFSIK